MGHITFAGTSYDWDENTLGLREAMDLEKATGLTVDEWGTGLQKGRAVCLAALIWLARRRNGETDLKFSDVDGDITSLEYVADEETDAEVPPTAVAAA